MSSEIVFCFVPEYEPDNQYYFAGCGTYPDGPMVERISGVQLWCQTSALDMLKEPATVIPVEDPNSYACFYKIQFKSDMVPGWFETREIDGKKVFCVPSPKFTTAAGVKHCIKIPNNDWSQCCLRFHCIAAMFRLGVISTMSTGLFDNKQSFFESCIKFYKEFKLPEPNDIRRDFATGFNTVFAAVWDALDFLGCTTPSTLSERDSVEAVRNMVQRYREGDETSGRFFAFSEISFAISKFNTTFFSQEADGRARTDILRYESYCLLLQTIDFVRRALIKKALIPNDCSPEEGLKKGLTKFQQANKFAEGPCDPFTLRALWGSPDGKKTDLAVFCRLAGIDIPGAPGPVCVRTLGKISIDDRELKPAAQLLNKIFGGIKNRAEIPEWLNEQALASGRSQMQRAEIGSKTVEDVTREMQELESKLKEVAEQNDISVRKIDDAGKILLRIKEERENLAKDIDVLKKRVDDEKSGNQILLVIVALLVVVLAIRLMKARK
jgi:hypothetical protein